MPPRSCSEVDGYGPVNDMHPLFYRSYAPPVSVEERSEKVGLRWPVERPDFAKHSRREIVAGPARLSDVTIYVGRNRTPFTVSVETLQSSAFFKSKIDRLREKLQDPSPSPISPIVVDCEESVFQNMMSLLRYGSLEALPKLSDADLYRLKKEVEFYGIDFADPAKKVVSCPSAVPVGVPGKATAAGVIPRHVSTSDLPDFPAELSDQAKLVLVARKDDEAKARCECTAPDQTSSWALSFHYRHAFCTGCSKPPSSMTPKLLAEMFMAAAMFYSPEHKLTSAKWYVGCDSTCTLKFLNARPCCTCPCSKQTTVWAVSTYHSHAFCTQCGLHAEGSTLVCILLTVRYGGLHRSPSKGGKKDHLLEVPINREAPKLQPAPAYKNRIRSPETLATKTQR